MRFARLSRVRQMLGSEPEELDIPHDASTFAEDDDYLILDLVLNWVSLLLRDDRAQSVRSRMDCFWLSSTQYETRIRWEITTRPDGMRSGQTTVGQRM